MEQTLYGDLLFFVNFCMDFQCLFLTAKLLRRPFPPLRAVLASAFGALYACAALFITVSGGAAFFADLAVCFLMCAAVFAARGVPLRGLFVPFALYFGVSFAVGGVMSGMATLLSHFELPIEASAGGISSMGFFLLAAVGGFCTFLWGRLCQRRAREKHAMLTLLMFGRELRVQGLVDTANLLCDPVSGRPVVILSVEAAREWLPPALRDLSPATVSSLPAELACRVRLIPTKTVTGGGLLIAFLPERAFVDAGKGNVPALPAVALAARESLPADCAALLPSAILNE